MGAQSSQQASTFASQTNSPSILICVNGQMYEVNRRELQRRVLEPADRSTTSLISAIYESSIRNHNEIHVSLPALTFQAFLGSATSRIFKPVITAAGRGSHHLNTPSNCNNSIQSYSVSPSPTFSSQPTIIPPQSILHEIQAGNRFVQQKASIAIESPLPKQRNLPITPTRSPCDRLPAQKQQLFTTTNNLSTNQVNPTNNKENGFQSLLNSFQLMKTQQKINDEQQQQHSTNLEKTRQSYSQKQVQNPPVEVVNSSQLCDSILPSTAFIQQLFSQKSPIIDPRQSKGLLNQHQTNVPTSAAVTLSTSQNTTTHTTGNTYSPIISKIRSLTPDIFTSNNGAIGGTTVAPGGIINATENHLPSVSTSTNEQADRLRSSSSIQLRSFAIPSYNPILFVQSKQQQQQQQQLQNIILPTLPDQTCSLAAKYSLNSQVNSNVRANTTSPLSKPSNLSQLAAAASTTITTTTTATLATQPSDQHEESIARKLSQLQRMSGVRKTQQQPQFVPPQHQSYNHTPNGSQLSSQLLLLQHRPSSINIPEYVPLTTNTALTPTSTITPTKLDFHSAFVPPSTTSTSFSTQLNSNPVDQRVTPNQPHYSIYSDPFAYPTLQQQQIQQQQPTSPLSKTKAVATTITTTASRICTTIPNSPTPLHQDLHNTSNRNYNIPCASILSSQSNLFNALKQTSITNPTTLFTSNNMNCNNNPLTKNTQKNCISPSLITKSSISSISRIQLFPQSPTPPPVQSNEQTQPTMNESPYRYESKSKQPYSIPLYSTTTMASSDSAFGFHINNGLHSKQQTISSPIPSPRTMHGTQEGIPTLALAQLKIDSNSNSPSPMVVVVASPSPQSGLFSSILPVPSMHRGEYESLLSTQKANQNLVQSSLTLHNLESMRSDEKQQPQQSRSLLREAVVDPYTDSSSYKYNSSNQLAQIAYKAATKEFLVQNQPFSANNLRSESLREAQNEETEDGEEEVEVDQRQVVVEEIDCCSSSLFAAAVGVNYTPRASPERLRQVSIIPKNVISEEGEDDTYDGRVVVVETSSEQKVNSAGPMYLYHEDIHEQSEVNQFDQQLLDHHEEDERVNQYFEHQANMDDDNVNNNNKNNNNNNNDQNYNYNYLPSIAQQSQLIHQNNHLYAHQEYNDIGINQIDEEDGVSADFGEQSEENQFRHMYANNGIMNMSHPLNELPNRSCLTSVATAANGMHSRTNSDCISYVDVSEQRSAVGYYMNGVEDEENHEQGHYLHSQDATHQVSEYQGIYDYQQEQNGFGRCYNDDDDDDDDDDDAVAAPADPANEYYDDLESRSSQDSQSQNNQDDGLREEEEELESAHFAQQQQSQFDTDSNSGNRFGSPASVGGFSQLLNSKNGPVRSIYSSNVPAAGLLAQLPLQNHENMYFVQAKQPSLVPQDYAFSLFQQSMKVKQQQEENQREQHLHYQQSNPSAVSHFGCVLSSGYVDYDGISARVQHQDVEQDENDDYDDLNDENQEGNNQSCEYQDEQEQQKLFQHNQGQHRAKFSLQSFHHGSATDSQFAQWNVVGGGYSHLEMVENMEEFQRYRNTVGSSLASAAAVAALAVRTSNNEDEQVNNGVRQEVNRSKGNSDKKSENFFNKQQQLEFENAYEIEEEDSPTGLSHVTGTHTPGDRELEEDSEELKEEEDVVAPLQRQHKSQQPSQSSLEYTVAASGRVSVKELLQMNQRELNPVQTQFRSYHPQRIGSGVMNINNGNHSQSQQQLNSNSNGNSSLNSSLQRAATVSERNSVQQNQHRFNNHHRFSVENAMLGSEINTDGKEDYLLRNYFAMQQSMEAPDGSDTHRRY